MNKKRSVFHNIIILIAGAVFLYAAFRLYGILKMYNDTDQLYEDVRDTYTNPAHEDPDAKSPNNSQNKKKKKEQPPIEVDWDDLKKKNPDIIGWIHVEAIPEMSFAIVQGKDNDFYLHRDINKNYLYAGCIFADYLNSPDFSDKVTLVYGHNMNNGSMFGKVKRLKDQSEFDKSHYFWILTPEENYKYEIFSVFDTSPDSFAYQLWGGDTEEFLKWEKKLKECSSVKTDTKLKKDDSVVMLSTCSHHTARTLCVGKCVSEDKPKREYKRYLISDYMGSIPKEQWMEKRNRWDLCSAMGDDGEKGIVVEATANQAKNFKKDAQTYAESYASQFQSVYGGSASINDKLTELNISVPSDRSRMDEFTGTIADIVTYMEVYQVFSGKQNNWHVDVRLTDETTGEIIYENKYKPELDISLESAE